MDPNSLLSKLFFRDVANSQHELLFYVGQSVVHAGEIGSRQWEMPLLDFVLDSLSSSNV